jgi:hypothetical protein
MFQTLLSLSVFASVAGAPLIDEGAEWSLGLCQASNSELLAQLRPDVNEEQLHQIAHDDAARHRLSVPRKADASIMGKVLCCPRFGVEQGVRPDGTKKLRAVDHFSWSYSAGQKKRKRREIKWSSINGHFTSNEAVKHDHLDDLLAAMKLQFETEGQAPGLWKADIDAAFRRVPLQESHQWAAAVAYLYHGEPWVAMHRTMPFGATASVVAWHKVGALLQDIARQLLHLPVFRYVDDYFASERYESLLSFLLHLLLLRCFL